MEWISIKERYPEHGIPILLNVETDDGGYYVLGLHDKENLKFYNDCEENIKASHWCVLPLPPMKHLKKNKKIKKTHDM